MCCTSTPPAPRCRSQRTLDATLNHLKLEAEIGGYEAAEHEAMRRSSGFYRVGRRG